LCQSARILSDRINCSRSSTQVWEAVRSGETKRIALKVLTSRYRKDKKEIAQLKHEAKIGKLLRHENVIEIYDYYDETGIPLVSMELFHAVNVKISIRERREDLLPILTPLIRQCVLGLKEMHEKGWVHCDVKPDNFLADDKGIVKLIDFSIGRKIKAGGLAGLFGGKPKAIHQLLKRHLTASIPSLESCSDASSDFAKLVKKMLAKKPENRFQSMADFLGVFERCQMFRSGKRPEGFTR